MEVFIDMIGEGKLKGHQINGSLPLGNIIVHLTLPQLIPHFDNLHWRMDKEHKLLRHIRRESPWPHVNLIGFR